MPKDIVLDEETTTPADTSTTETVTDALDALPDPDLNDESSDAYAAAMDEPAAPADETPTEPSEPAVEEAAAEDVATSDAETLWRREGSRFVKYVAPEPPKTEPPVPFKANVYGKEQEVIPGALYKPGVGVLIPENRVADLHRLAAHASKYGDVAQLRQERAKLEQQSNERMTFYGQKFSEVLQSTLLNPEWFAWAAASPENFQTAQMQVQLKLQQGEMEATTKFGAMPTTTANANDAEPLDPYEAEASVDGYLNELLASPDYHGTLTPEDTAIIKAQLKEQDVPIFVRHPELGWSLDERPIRSLVALRFQSVKAGRTAPKVEPKVEQVTRRNAAAVPKITEPAANAAPKPATAAPPKDKYADQPWNNPELPFQERKRLFSKAKGFANVAD